MGFYGIPVFLFAISCLIGSIKVAAHNGERFSPECKYNKVDFGILTGRVIGGVQFLEKHVSELVLDSGIGTKILGDQIALTLKKNFRLPTAIRKFLQKLLRKSETVTGSIVANIKESDTISEEEKRNTLPWGTTPSLMESPELYKWKTFPINVTKSKLLFEDLDMHKPEVMTEKLSDGCIGSLFENCQLAEECSNIFLGEPLSQYSLNHQVFYMLFAKHTGCLSEPAFQKKIGTNNGDEFFEQLCSKVWVETNYIARSDFPSKLRDLFTEGVVACSLAGFEEFLSRDWLQTILTWQSPNCKCFPYYYSEDDDETEENPANINDNYRMKRSEVIVHTTENESCSAHFTAVGIAALGIHIRKLLEGCLN